MKVQMPFPNRIEAALRQYDKNKGFHRRLLGDEPAIKALRKLSDADKGNLFRLFQCFLKNMPKPKKASYQVYRALLQQTSDPHHVSVLLQVLHRMDLLHQDNFDAVVAQTDAATVARTLIGLRKRKLLTGSMAQKYCDAIIKHPDPLSVVESLLSLYREGLLTEEGGLRIGLDTKANFDKLVAHLDPGAVVRILLTLKEQNQELLTGSAAQANFAAVINLQDPVLFEYFALNTLICTGLLTGPDAHANFDAVVRHADPDAVAAALNKLKEQGLLSSPDACKYRTVVSQHENPKNMAKALCLLDIKSLFTDEWVQANFSVITAHANPLGVVEVLDQLYNAANSGLSARDNLDIVVRHSDPRRIAAVLRLLNKARTGLLEGPNAQAGFDAIAQHQNLSGVVKAIEKMMKDDTLLIIPDILKGNYSEDKWHQVLWDALIMNYAHPERIVDIFRKVSHDAALSDEELEPAACLLVSYIASKCDDACFHIDSFDPPFEIDETHLPLLITVLKEQGTGLAWLTCGLLLTGVIVNSVNEEKAENKEYLQERAIAGMQFIIEATHKEARLKTLVSGILWQMKITWHNYPAIMERLERVDCNPAAMIDPATLQFFSEKTSSPVGFFASPTDSPESLNKKEASETAELDQVGMTILSVNLRI